MRSNAKSAAVAALMWVSGASVAAAQVVVLNARGPSAGAYPQGAVLAGNRTISLKAGDRLEVLDAAGSHLLEGPMSLPAGQIATGSKSGLQDVFRRANASRPGIAAVRGFSLDEGKSPAPTEVAPLWRLDLMSWDSGEPSEAHSFCVMRGAAPVLTRGGGGAEGKLVIYRDSTHSSRTVTWAAGARDLNWPTDLTYSDGELFSLNLDAQGAAAVRWRTVPADATSLTALASALLDAGCFDQLDTLQSQVAAK